MSSVPSVPARHEPAPLPKVSLALPPDSGLVLVETRFAAPPAEEPEAETLRPRRVRPPRVALAEEPLQMVETRKGETP